MYENHIELRNVFEAITAKVSKKETISGVKNLNLVYIKIYNNI